MALRVDTDGTTTAYTESAIIPSAQGTGYGQVNGQRYKLKKVRVRGRVTVPNLTTQTTVAQPRLVRILLIMDVNPNKAQAQGEAVMQDFGTASENLFAFKNVASNSGRFRILKDEFIELQPVVAANNASATTVSQAFESKAFSFQYQPREAIMVNVVTGSATPGVAQLINCNIFMLAYCATSAAANQVNIDGCTRAYYCE
jgi:hypothetical protein